MPVIARFRAGLVVARTVGLTLIVCAAGLAATASVERARAQEAAERPWTLRDLLFPRRERRTVPPGIVPHAQPAPAVRARQPKPPKPAKPAKPRKVEVRRQQPRPAKPAPPPVVMAHKDADARPVLVVGDFVATGVAEGLEAIFADNKKVRVVDRTSGSSGLVRDDFFDWPGQISKLVATTKPAAVVFVLGANDRQQMRLGAAREGLRTQAWTVEYTARASAFATLVAAAKVPLVWLGAPSFKVPRANSDMLAMNEIFRATAARTGGEFIDVWDGFVDETGAFVASGPDVNGLPVRLRANDGINFTDAGKRKLAFYAEKPLKKILGEALAPEKPAVALAVPASPRPAPAASSAVPDRTDPILINDPSLDGGGELLGASAEPGAKPATPAQRLFVDGLGAEARPGRADDFASRPRALDAPATAETTTSTAN